MNIVLFSSKTTEKSFDINKYTRVVYAMRNIGQGRHRNNYHGGDKKPLDERKKFLCHK